MSQVSPTLDELIATIEEVSKEVEHSFGKLTTEQLNWKPHPESWSIAQCLDHLIRSNEPFIPTIEAVKQSSWRPSLWERVPVLPGIMGRLLVDAVSPNAARKLKAPGKFQPSSSDIGGEVVRRFLEMQKAILDLMRSTSHLDLNAIIITSPAMSFITYSLFDGYRVISNHEQRHLAQAKRVLDADEFPRREAK
jgi:hypothetical protein